jgi:hypothetical protein
MVLGHTPTEKTVCTEFFHAGKDSRTGKLATAEPPTRTKTARGPSPPPPPDPTEAHTCFTALEGVPPARAAGRANCRGASARLARILANGLSPHWQIGPGPGDRSGPGPTGSPPGLARPPWGCGRGRAEGTESKASCSFSFPLWGFVSSPMFFSGRLAGPTSFFFLPHFF